MNVDPQRTEDTRVLSTADWLSGWLNSATAARLVNSRLYPWADALWLAVEQAVVLSCAERLFPALIAQRSAAAVAAILSGGVWLLGRRTQRSATLSAAEGHVAAMRGALASVLWRSLLVLVTMVSLGLVAHRAQPDSVPLSAVAFLMWCAAAATPLFDAGRAVLEFHAAEHALDLASRQRATTALGTGPLHALRGQLRRDTLPTRAFLLSMSILGLFVSAGLALWALAAPTLFGSERLAPLWFSTPIGLLVALSTSALFIQLRLQTLPSAPEPPAAGSPPATRGVDAPASLAVLFWLPRGLSGCTLVSGFALLLVAALWAGLALRVPSTCLCVFLGIAASCWLATSIVQWTVLRWLCDRTRDHLTRTGLSPLSLLRSAPLRRLSPGAAQRKARRSVSLATLAVLCPPLLSISALWLSRQPSQPATYLIVLSVVAGLLVLAVVTTLRRLGGALRPLAEATRQAAALAAAPDDAGVAQQAPSRKTKQRTRLATTLLAMQEALRQRLVHSTQAQARLEGEVAARTRELLQRNQDIERNIELLSQAEQALSEAEKLAAIGQFVAGIAHEINNPINAALNAARPLRDALADLQNQAQSPQTLTTALSDPELAAMLRVVQRGSQRAAEIVRGLYSYAERDAQPLLPVDIHRTLEEAWELVQHPKKTQLHVVRSLQATRPVVGQAGQLQQVFVNLLSNAVHALAERPQAAPPGPAGAESVPTLDIQTADVGDEVHIVIRDNGPGIPRALHTRIFEPFFTTKDATQGSGLGLAIVHSILTRHRGRIELQSAPGQGARFRVMLPSRVADPVADTAMAAASHGEPAAR